MRGSLTAAQEFVLRLKAELQRTPPEMFDYRVSAEHCGCVMPAAKRAGMSAVDWPLKGYASNYLAGGEEEDIDSSAKSFEDMSATEARGSNGLREAIRRCDVVLARLSGARQ